MYPVTVTRGNKIAMLSIYALFITSFTQAQCIASGPNSAAAAANVASGPGYNFNDHLNCLLSDNNRTIAPSLIGVGPTDYLQATDFGFSIPTAATICGIEVNVEKSATNLLLNITNVEDNSVLIIKNGSRTGSNMAQSNTWSEDVDAVSTYGNNNALWGTTWAPADINSADFGVAISAEIEGIFGLLPSARIDYISITVYYLDPSVLSAQAIQFNVANGTNQSAVLSWKANAMAVSETVSIERSANGKTWDALSGTVQKNNITSLLIFTDNQPLPGKSLYRLKMVTTAGNVRYTTAQPFEQKDHTFIKCFPNPFTSSIQVSGVMAGEQVTLTDVYGKRLYYSLPTVNNTLRIDVSHLQPGIYVICAGTRKMKIQKK
jgi:hypothetical protein